MTDKEKIRAEIKRRIALYSGLSEETVNPNRIDEDRQILSFIDSMQKEPACEDLEQEITKYCNTIYRNWTEDARKKDSLVEELCKQTARHFAKWGDERVNRRILDKMNQIKDKQICYDFDIEIEDFMSEDLEKSAIKYAQDKYMSVQTSQTFKAGVQWCKQQMMKKAVDVGIDSSRSDGKTILSGNFFKYNTGDKVKIIIVKED